MLQKMLNPEGRRAISYAAQSLGKIGVISVASIYSGKVLREAVDQFTVGMSNQVKNIRSMYYQ